MSAGPIVGLEKVRLQPCGKSHGSYSGTSLYSPVILNRLRISGPEGVILIRHWMGGRMRGSSHD
jgi:hypothetical protein